MALLDAPVYYISFCIYYTSQESLIQYSRVFLPNGGTPFEPAATSRLDVTLVNTSSYQVALDNSVNIVASDFANRDFRYVSVGKSLSKTLPVFGQFIFFGPPAPSDITDLNIEASVGEFFTDPISGEQRPQVTFTTFKAGVRTPNLFTILMPCSYNNNVRS